MAPTALAHFVTLNRLTDVQARLLHDSATADQQSTFGDRSAGSSHSTSPSIPAVGLSFTVP